MNDRSAPAVPYLVFSWEHNGFWRPGRCGYTRLIEEAGRYSKEDAEAICANALPTSYKASAGEPPEICFPAPEAFDQLAKVAVRVATRLDGCDDAWRFSNDVDELQDASGLSVPA